jgi:hypothetical protein
MSPNRKDQGAVMNNTKLSLFCKSHDAPDAVANWLRPIQWQLFATLEFPWRARPETAGRKFAELVDKMERSLRTRVCYVNATETRSKTGSIVPLHFHAAFTAVRPISHQLVAGIWNASVGRAASEAGDLAQVEPYDLSRDGIRYITKLMADPDCGLDLRNVHLFNKAIAVETKQDHASLRAARRLIAQAGVGSNSPRGLLRVA